MRITVKRNLCILNTFLSAIAFLCIHATMWLGKGASYESWLYWDCGIEGFLLAIPVMLAFWSVFWNPEKSKRGYIVAAVVQAVPAIIFTIGMAIGDNVKSQLVGIWRVIPAIILFVAASVVYFVIAFTQNIETPKVDKSIPYSD